MEQHPLIGRFVADMEETELLPPGATLFAGVSGGSDSMALLALLLAGAPRFQWNVTAVHVNHGLRPDAAADEDFVRRWCEQASVTFRAVPVAVASGHGRSLEMAARDARREALLVQAGAPDAFVVLAHQADDQAETVLIRILRGTSVGGLSAMRPRMGQIVRPLLSYRRETLRDMLTALAIPWREDPSNEDRAMVRNRVRLDLLPSLAETYNPRITEALIRLSRAARLLDDWAAGEATRWCEGHLTALPDAGGLRLLNFTELPEALGRKVLRTAALGLQLHVTEEQIDRAAAGEAVWPRHHRVAREGGDLVITPRARPVVWPAEVSAPVWPGEAALPVGRLVTERNPAGPGRLALLAAVEELSVRGWRPGDRIRMAAGHRKLQDVFVDAKVPRALRAAWPVLVDPTGTVVMVPELAVDAGWCARPDEPGWVVRWEHGPA